MAHDVIYCKFYILWGMRIKYAILPLMVYVFAFDTTLRNNQKHHAQAQDLFASPGIEKIYR